MFPLEAGSRSPELLLVAKNLMRAAQKTAGK
jgi:hypothetical protein